MAMKTSIVSVLMLVACGSKTNPDACCTDAADCTLKGLPEGSMCGDGLLCRGNTCVAETCDMSTSCDESAPYCVNSLCAAACTDDAQCPGAGGTAGNLYCDAGTCVECRENSNCPSDKAFCDMSVCRGCIADSECTSGLCGNTGTCVDSSTIVYLDPAGLDGGSCGQSAPCKTITFGQSKTSATRSTILMGMGQYVEAVRLTPATGLATNLVIHGVGAVVTTPTLQDSTAFVIDAGFANVRLDGLTLTKQHGNGIMASSPLELHSVVSDGGFYCILAQSGLTAYNVKLSKCGNGVDVYGQLTADRLAIDGGTSGMFTGLRVETGAVVTVANLVVRHAQQHCIELTDQTHGTISFATVADCGSLETAAPLAVDCTNSSVAFLSSIIWAPGAYDELSSCSLSKSLVGPNAVTGIPSSDPQFVNFASGDLRLTSTSPAIDIVPTGPATDVVGTARPQGTAFDIGAYEYKP